MTDYFKEYRKAYDEMLADQDLQDAAAEMVLATARMVELEAPYKERLERAEEGIRAVVIDQQRTMALYNIMATYSKPRKSTSWKAVALEYDPPAELIEKHSKVGHPSVKIEVLDGKEP